MKNYAFETSCFSKISFMFLLVTLLIGTTLQSDAQTLYRAVMAADLDLVQEPLSELVVEAANEVKCEGRYLIKDGQLDEIYNLKFVLPSVQLNVQSTNSNLGGKKVTFEQTQVMVLPMMGMVHVVGFLTIGGVSNTSSFLLKFKVNSDQSISFNGEKSVKLLEYFPAVSHEMMDEVQLNIDFVLKNAKNNTGFVTAD
ncbi:hypothetical protein [Pedobacter insulae]|uniref:YceI-like domain-containing protein n=1 Tax=Pedobacter insulae TaxID=414048 RepID=A0A1I3A647_9SPHI|nr:hypothetical protein [Pedobacter insulae]SFH45583.1 hypothetical protein SAMN04489864_11337 [Pedobacter insulae]